MAVFRFEEIEWINKYYEFESGNIFRIEMALNKTLTMLKGLNVRLYVYSSTEYKIMNYNDIKNPELTMTKLSTYKWQLP